MTPEQLLGMTADELDKLTPEQLNGYFQKYFPVTRPELAQKIQTTPNRVPRAMSSSPRPTQLVLTDKQKQALAIMASQGEDISFIQDLQKRGKR